MSRLHIVRAPHVHKWVSLLCPESNFTTSSSSNFYVNGLHHLVQRNRLYGTESSADLENGVGFGDYGRKTRAVREQAQSALVEYFHLTRNFKFMDAESMTKHAPEFFNRLMKRIDIDDDKINYLNYDTVHRSVTRFLRYHPVNEFEPFFESIGLKYFEYEQFLPMDLMFLDDDQLLLENYNVLCNYGIERSWIGRIFVEANEVFRYEHGALQAKLRFFEDLGLKKSLVVKIVLSSPRLLTGNAGEFVEFLGKLKKVEIEYDWLLKHIHQDDSYNWGSMLQLMCLLCKLGWSEKLVGQLFKEHPDLLLESSGRISFVIIGMLLKCGSTMSNVQTFLLQFPKMPVSKFAYNLHYSYNFLVEIYMAAKDVAWMVRSYPLLLGSIALKKVSSIVIQTQCGKNSLCQMVKDDPFILEGWAKGRKVKRLYTEKRGITTMALKTQFLISLGYEENSKEMEFALKSIMGRGEELQHRFHYFMKIGLSHDEVIRMVKISPRILNQTCENIETKVRFFFDDLGYRASDLLAYPKMLQHSIKRLKLRLLTYKWLRDQGAVHPNLAVSTLLGSTDKEFIRLYVNSHTRGPDFWNSLCQMVKGDSFILEGLAHGRKVERLCPEKRGLAVMAFKTRFLISLGYEENSKEMKKALKSIRGRVEELPHTVDYLMKIGLSREEVITMVKIAPKILNQTCESTEAKVRFFFDDLGYRVSDLLAYPKILQHSIKRLKPRLLTYKWLRDQGAVHPNLSFSTLLDISYKDFMRRYVNSHARGPDFWKSLDKNIT